MTNSQPANFFFIDGFIMLLIQDRSAIDFHWSSVQGLNTASSPKFCNGENKDSRLQYVNIAPIQTALFKDIHAV